MKTEVLAAALGACLLVPGAAGAQANRFWTLDIPKAPLDVAHLIYLAPTSGAPVLAASCRKKTGQVIASFDVAESLAADRRGDVWVDRIGRPAPWPVSVTLTSAGVSTTLRGQAHPNAQGGSTVSVEAASRAPLFDAWKTSAELKLEAMDETVAPPPAKKGLISRFLRYCG